MLRWGVLATGNIARKFVRGLSGSAGHAVVAVASRDADRAAEFAAAEGVPRSFGSYAALCAAPDIDVVYTGTPHPQHRPDVELIVAAGRHVLCEKPLAVHLADAEAMVAAARGADRFLMEAYRYRFHPQTHRLVGLVADGAIGAVRQIAASYGFVGSTDPRGRLLDPALGGGGILDVGCYPLSLARLVAGASRGLPFADPLAVHAAGHLGATGVDEHASALLDFGDGLHAHVHCAVRLRLDNTVTVSGETGSIALAWPWNPELHPDQATLVLRRDGAEPQVERVTASCNLWQLQADEVAAHLERRESPRMSWADSLGNQRALDAWRRALGLRYPGEDHACVRS